MEKELTIIVAAVSAYLGLPPGRIDLPEVSADRNTKALRFPAAKPQQPLGKQLWRWSFTTAHKNNSCHININLENGRSNWQQAAL